MRRSGAGGVVVGCVLVGVVASCGPGLPSGNRYKNPGQVAAEPLVAANGDVARIRALLHASVVYGGLLFEDVDCTRQFAAPGEVHDDQLDAFATCLAHLRLQTSARGTSMSNAAALTYASGIEVEARFDNAHALEWIGFMGRHDVRDAMPIISAAELETLRVGGDPHGTIDATAHVELQRAIDEDTYHHGPAHAIWFKVCLDATGEVTSARPFQASSARAFDIFQGATVGWRFRPFVAAGHAVPACAYVRLGYPVASPSEAVGARLPLALFVERDRLFIEERGLGERTAGESRVAPNDAARAEQDRIDQGRSGASSPTADIRFCIDVSGGVDSVDVVESSGNAPWDAQLLELVRRWRYAPVIVGGQPTPVCSITRRF